MLEALEDGITKDLRQDANAMAAPIHEMAFGAKTVRQIEPDCQIDSVHTGTKGPVVAADKTRYVKKHTRCFD